MSRDIDQWKGCWTWLAPKRSEVLMSHYDYFLLSSFEYTCDGNKSQEPREIIEFCVVKYNVAEQQCEEKFYSLVKPVHEVNAKLSTFCKMLTGVTDRSLATAPSLNTILKDFDIWLWHQGLHQKRFIFVPYDHFDLIQMLPNQCEVFGYHCPAYFFSWVHLEQLHLLWLSEQAAKPGNKPAKKMLRRNSTQQVLKSHNIKQQGRQHSAVDNCMNTAQLISAMLLKGADLSHIWNTPSKEELQSPQPETPRANPLDMLMMRKCHEEIHAVPVEKARDKCHAELLSIKK